MQNNKQAYGHAIIYVSDANGKLTRIGARVGMDGSIMVGAHCEWI